VPPLLAEERKRIDPKHPFFEHGTVQLFLAYRDGRPVGRIAAIENRLHNEFHGDRVGFFGMFESVDDPEVAGALLDRAAEWVVGRGLDRLRGPTNFSTNEECGLLIENFDDPPYVMMTYNPPYYDRLLTGWGLEKVKDLLAYRVREEEVNRARLATVERLVSRLRPRMSARPIRMNRFAEEVGIVRDIYNAAWERNWGFVPMTDAEVEYMAKQLKPVVDPELALIGEVEGEPAAFALALPDVNQAIRRLNGRLLPFGIIKLLWHMRRINGIRVITLGLKPEYRRTGLAELLYYEIIQRGRSRGHTVAETSWILEDNLLMRAGLEKMGARVYKTYRLYERDLGAL
jgi:GNAT superfamily N-acetyltransferase